MTVIAIGSTRGSPGVTCLATGLAFAAVGRGYGRPLLIEADPAGGVLGLRFSLAMQSSFASLASQAGRSSSPHLIDEHGTDLVGVQCLAAPADYLITQWIISRSAGYLANVLPRTGRPIVIDIGRIGQDSPSLALAKIADLVLLVTRPTLEEAQSALFGVRTLHAAGCNASLVCIGQKPYDPSELADLAGVRLHAVLPHDDRAAVALRGGNQSARSFKRTALWRSITSLANGLLIPAPNRHRSARTNPSGPHQNNQIVRRGPVPQVVIGTAVNGLPTHDRRPSSPSPTLSMAPPPRGEPVRGPIPPGPGANQDPHRPDPSTIRRALPERGIERWQ